MKPVFAPIAIANFVTGAMAQTGATALNMTCAAAKGTVAALRTGPTTYDRYVRDASFCELQEMVRPVWVRTADTDQCPIGGVCRSVEIDNGR